MFASVRLGTNGRQGSPRSPGHGGSGVGAVMPGTTGSRSRDGRFGSRGDDTEVSLRGCRSANAQTGWSPPRRRQRHPHARARPVDVALVVERHGDLARTCPSAAARRPSCAGSGPARAACSASCRACARSCAASRSARTSPAVRAHLGDVACRSTLRAGDLIHASSAPAPTTAVSAPSGALTYERGVPAGSATSVGRRRRPQPVRAAAGVAGEVGRRPRRAAPRERSVPAAAGWRRRARRPARGTTSARSSRQREARERALEAGDGWTGRCRRRCRTGSAPAAGLERRERAA
jgi:hypothetical protein